MDVADASAQLIGNGQKQGNIADIMAGYSNQDNTLGGQLADLDTIFLEMGRV